MFWFRALAWVNGHVKQASFSYIYFDFSMVKTVGSIKSISLFGFRLLFNYQSQHAFTLDRYLRHIP